jgi:hypothetical protein
MDEQKKISAAIAAVMHYLQEEQAILAQQAAMGGMAQASPAAAAGYSPWSMNGRQAQMQMRNLMQLRTFQRGARF